MQKKEKKLTVFRIFVKKKNFRKTLLPPQN